MGRKQRVLVCGASGFIGRNVFEALSHRDDLKVYGTYRTRCFSRSQRIAQADFTNRQDAMRVLANMDVVVQCAAVTSGARDIVARPYIHVTDNLIMNALLFEAAHKYRIPHVIFLSCTLMYPMNLDCPVKEDDVDLNSGMHEKYFGGGWMKVCCEKLCEFYSRLGETKFTIIRHSNIYGPYDKFDLERSHVFGATVAKVMRAESGGSIIVWGDGAEKRDLLYISDLVDFIKLVITKQGPVAGLDTVNVGQGETISVSHLVRKIIHRSGKRITIEFDLSKPTIPSKLALDCSHAWRMYGWRPQVGLNDGITKTLVWYEENMR